MPYTTPTAVREVLVAGGGASPSSDQSTAASMTDAQLQPAIDEAIAEVDARLRGAPFSDPAPRVVQDMARDLAAYLATLTHRKDVELEDAKPVYRRYIRARDLLRDLAKGDAELPVEPAGGVSVPVVKNPYEGSLFRPQDLGLHETYR